MINNADVQSLNNKLVYNTDYVTSIKMKKV